MRISCFQFNFIVCLVLFLIIRSQNEIYAAEPEPVNGVKHQSEWVDSVFASMSLDQRIAQLMMIRVHTDRDNTYYDNIVGLVRDYNIGGVAFFRGGPKRQVLVTNRLQSQARTPLLVAMDAEWGPAMRLDSLPDFPRQMALGAIRDDDLIYQMGLEVGRQLKRLGVHINFAPVVDVNNNFANPVINFRSFGEDREKVASKGLAYMKGMQDMGIIACAKHFPGHGDTDADSHHTLPLLRHSFEEIDSIHLYPFKQLIDQGLHAVMTAHLEIPSLEPEERLAATLSYNTITTLLQHELGFEGLVITDALDMSGVSDFFDPGELELRALLAGNDILLLPENVPAAVNTIKKAVEEGHLPESIINEKCRKILYYKEKVGLDTFTYASPYNLVEDLISPHGELLNRKLAESAITLLRNEKNLLPLRGLDRIRIAALSVGADTDNHFHSMLSRYSPVDLFGIDKYHTPERAVQLIGELREYDLVIISVHDNSYFPSRNYGINGKTVGLISSIASSQDVVLSLFANPYSIGFFEEGILDVESVIVAYEEGENFEEAAAKAIFGGTQMTGRLPVSAGKYFKGMSGITGPEPVRVGFGSSAAAGINEGLLSGIDSIAEEGIRMRAYPGCQVAVIKDGIMIYNKSFGYHTYDSIRRVSTDHLYDLASITKIAATTLSVMHLVDQGRIDLDRGVSYYLPWLGDSNKGDISLRQLMTHQARLTPWIPFYLSTIENGDFVEGIYSNEQCEEYPVRVAEYLYIHASYRDSIYDRIRGSELLSGSSSYRYSDLGFILLAEIIENVTGLDLANFTEYAFFRPMGLSSFSFNPLGRFPADAVVPSENDTIWRKQVVRGHVHDPAAAMLGGVSGHAGLFSNASDLAVLMHIIMNGGWYGGDSYLTRSTVEEFTRVQFPGNDNRRGIGFDKPALDSNRSSPAAENASPFSFGHSGFTGTLAWADPVEDLVFVFLSNRTYPSQDNNLITRENIRTKIHQVIYDAIEQSRSEDQHTNITDKQ